MSRIGLKFSQMILHTSTSKMMNNLPFLLVVLHKPTLWPSTFKAGFCSLSQKWLLLTQAWNVNRLFGPMWKKRTLAIHEIQVWNPGMKSRYENFLKIFWNLLSGETLKVYFYTHSHCSVSMLRYALVNQAFHLRLTVGSIVLLPMHATVSRTIVIMLSKVKSGHYLQLNHYWCCI